ncbi:MAG: amidohydrolase [Bacteroidetes bacterium]|nr:MAG: amidohydrolase [Bacteroidota bacterium]MBL1143510.1 amidohydrolase [Bacteroidota bacterium]NOG56313.1 amidohydrolase [Bacteroidota bacterium]
MHSELIVSQIQTDLVWENAAANLAKFSELILSIEQTDVIILPETFNTGFSMNSAKLAEKMDGKTMQWMRQEAKKANAVVCGSIIIEENQHYYNRFIWMQPDGSLKYYNKRHLFRMGEEHKNFSPGSEKIIIEYKGWKICPMICYDLRFPVWSRNQEQYDLLIYVANWPEVRINAWEKLLFARAIENQSYVASVNRIGMDGLGVNCSGSSMLIDPKGDCIWKAKNQTESINTTSISLDDLNEFRNRFPVGMDADAFEVK